MDEEKCWYCGHPMGWCKTCGWCLCTCTCGYSILAIIRRPPTQTVQPLDAYL